MKSTWRNILASAPKTPLEGFKRYKTDNGVDLPQKAEFTGDLFPTKTGDPAKVELKAFEEGNTYFDKDVARENAAADHGSALMSEKAKYKDVAKQMTEKPAKPVNASWRAVLSDMSLKQKPDGTVQLDITSQPGQPLFNNTQTGQPGALSPEQTQNTTAPPAALPTDGEVVAEEKKPVAKASVKTAEEGMFEQWFSDHYEDPTFREEYQKYLLENSEYDVEEAMDYEQWMQFRYNEATTGMPQQALAKKWLIDKVGSLRLVGRECNDYVGVMITSNHKEVESSRVQRNGHEWKELIPQGVWQAKLQDYAAK